MKKEHPVPQHHENSVHLSLFLAPVNFRWAVPLKNCMYRIVKRSGPINNEGTGTGRYPPIPVGNLLKGRLIVSSDVVVEGFSPGEDFTTLGTFKLFLANFRFRPIEEKRTLELN